MKITVYGSGYVGLVAAACFAQIGHDVLCMDVDTQKIRGLQQGIVPIYEPGLDALIRDLSTKQQLAFGHHAKDAVLHGECHIIAVGTPPDKVGKADLSFVLSVARTIAEYMTDYTVIVNKSTVPIGTADKVRQEISQILDKRNLHLAFDVVSNPEFLKEGVALKDFRDPDRIILGLDSPRAEKIVKQLYAPFEHAPEKIITMDQRSAELTKYAANAMLATKISFMNEMANLAEKVGADIEKVRVGIGTDQRIGHHFIQAGCGYGGSCFGKDIQALTHTAHDYEVNALILEAVEQTNKLQKRQIFHKIQRHFDHNLQHKIFAVWGLAFKPETDDMRDAPSIVVLEALWRAGARVQVYDPQAMQEAQKIFGKREGLAYCANKEETLEGADALVIFTQWEDFKTPDFVSMQKTLKKPTIFDGRNMYDPALLASMGFDYYGIGRGKSLGPLS